MTQAIQGQSHIVLDDPTGQWWPGALVESGAVGSLAGRGVATIPVATDLLPSSSGVSRTRRNGVLGFYRRDYGAGWTLGMVPGPVAPSILYVVPNYPVIHWRARIVPGSVLVEGAARKGVLRACSDTTQAGTSQLVVSAPSESTIDLGKLPEPDARGGWTIGGYVVLNATMEGYAGLALWGACAGQVMRVAWVAFAQAKQ